MNLTHLRQNKIGFVQPFRTFRDRRRFRHDPWLVFNMAAFNSKGSKRVDEALWSAYHRNDKAAVTKELISRVSVRGVCGGVSHG